MQTKIHALELIFNEVTIPDKLTKKTFCNIISQSKKIQKLEKKVTFRHFCHTKKLGIFSDLLIPEINQTKTNHSLMTLT